MLRLFVEVPSSAPALLSLAKSCSCIYTQSNHVPFCLAMGRYASHDGLLVLLGLQKGIKEVSGAAFKLQNI